MYPSSLSSRNLKEVETSISETIFTEDFNKHCRGSLGNERSILYDFKIKLQLLLKVL